MGTKAKLIMLKGLPGSGKSTWAKQQVKDNPKKITRVNKDDLRALMHNSHWSKDNENEVVSARNAIILNALCLGKTVIVDDTNFAPLHEEKLRELASVYDSEFEIKFFDADLDTCIKRDARRENPVGRKVILDMYDKYVRKEIPVIPYVDSLPDAIIVDVDGTLAHISCPIHPNGKGK